jgi:hypothetical protein
MNDSWRSDARHGVGDRGAVVGIDVTAVVVVAAGSDVVVVAAGGRAVVAGVLLAEPPQAASASAAEDAARIAFTPCLSPVTRSDPPL